jgi:hypothetical protein
MSSVIEVENAGSVPGTVGAFLKYQSTSQKKTSTE